MYRYCRRVWPWMHGRFGRPSFSHYVPEPGAIWGVVLSHSDVLFNAILQQCVWGEGAQLLSDLRSLTAAGFHRKCATPTHIHTPILANPHSPTLPTILPWSSSAFLFPSLFPPLCSASWNPSWKEDEGRGEVTEEQRGQTEVSLNVQGAAFLSKSDDSPPTPLLSSSCPTCSPQNLLPVCTPSHYCLFSSLLDFGSQPQTPRSLEWVPFLSNKYYTLHQLFLSASRSSFLMLYLHKHHTYLLLKEVIQNFPPHSQDFDSSAKNKT